MAQKGEYNFSSTNGLVNNHPAWLLSLIQLCVKEKRLRVLTSKIYSLSKNVIGGPGTPQSVFGGGKKIVRAFLWEKGLFFEKKTFSHEKKPFFYKKTSVKRSFLKKGLGKKVFFQKRAAKK